MLNETPANSAAPSDLHDLDRFGVACTIRNVESDWDALFLGKYVVKETIGTGAQGKVKAAIDVTTNKEVAIKLIRKSSDDPTAMSHSLLEAALTSKIPYHNNICNMIETAETHKYLTIVMERGETDIFECLKEGTLNMPAAKRIIKQLLMALQHCHAHGVAHRDIKPENILLSGSSDPATATAKLCDFGLAKDISTTHNGLLSSRVGTAAYAAPEILEGLEYDGRAADVFSLGVALFNFATSFEPWSSAVESDPLFNRFGNIPSDYWTWARTYSPRRLGANFEDLFGSMCAMDPADRPTAADCLAHPFFDGVDA